MKKLKETIKNIMKEESEYQTFFKKALEKAGKSIPSMSDEEKKAFFDKIDAAWDAKGEKKEVSEISFKGVKNFFSKNKNIDSNTPNRNGEWYYDVAYEAEEILQKKYKLKNHILSAMGPGDKTTVIFIATYDSTEKNSPEYEWKVYFDKNDKVTKIEPDNYNSRYILKNKNKLEGLSGNQHKLDVDGDGEIEASDLAALRAGNKKDESVNEASIKVGDTVKVYDPQEGEILVKVLSFVDKNRIEVKYKNLIMYAERENGGRWSIDESVKEGLSADIAKHMGFIHKGFVKVEDDGTMIYDSPANAKKASDYLNSKKIATSSNGKYLYIESVNENFSSSDIEKIKGAVEKASSFMGIGKELKSIGMKYDFMTSPYPVYMVKKGSKTYVLINKKYAEDPEFVIGDTAGGLLEGKVNEGKLGAIWQKNNKKGYVLKVGNVKLESGGPSGTHTIYKGKNEYVWGKFHLDYESGGVDWWVEPGKGNDFWVDSIDDIVKRVEADSRFNEGKVNESQFKSGDKVIISHPTLIKPFKSVVGTVLTPNGNEVLVLKSNHGIWDAKFAKLDEGNAFGAAVTKAKKEGKKEFEFNGKTYKVKKGSYEKNESAKKLAEKSEAVTKK